MDVGCSGRCSDVQKDGLIQMLQALLSTNPISLVFVPEKKKLTFSWLEKSTMNESMWMFPKIVGFPPKSSILIRFSIIFTIHFGVFFPIFGVPPMYFPIENWGDFPSVFSLQAGRGALS